MAATKVDTGCEIAIKIANDAEMYLYASGTNGNNCYDATARIIDNCPSSNGQSGWINGPNFGEFYQVGVRKLNGQGAKHSNFADNNHLGYNQARCIRDEGSLFYIAFYIDSVNWDDGDWGKSLLSKQHGCGAVTGWTWEPSESGKGTDFGGGQIGDHYGSFNLPRLIGAGCVERGIEAAMDLPSGTVSCVGIGDPLSCFPLLFC
ncbi:MAG: hypothetical protein M1813_005107 [Trichoglossum hirsutum]|jgi:hypothetical protein|nr:MAG: hypothetical protein M1813_005107 [Trichoglossum hirsutum]